MASRQDQIEYITKDQANWRAQRQDQANQSVHMALTSSEHSATW
jgi:hypothetical protein